MKGIVNLPAVTATATTRRPSRRPRSAAPVLTAKVIPALRPVAVAPVSLRYRVENLSMTTRDATDGYAALDGDAPDITGRAVNILI